MCKECGGTCGGSKVSGMGRKKGKMRGVISGGRIMRNGLNVAGAYAGNRVGAMVQENEIVQSNRLLANGMLLLGTIVFGDKVAVMVDNMTKSDAGTMLVTNIGASCVDPLLEEAGLNGIESEPDWANQYGYNTYEYNTDRGGDFRVDA